jgi:hypothetical protein
VDGLLDWYWLGVALGLGVAAGAGRVGALGGRTIAGAAIAGAIVIAALAVVWAAAAAALGLALVVFFFRHLSREAVLAATLVLAVLSFVPALGYLEALVAPLLGQRLSRRTGQRYAGLRVLAKD